MQHVQFEDSIDDLISLLNFQKSSTKNLRETTNLPSTTDDAFEVGNLLNSSHTKLQPKQPPRNLSANSDKAPLKTLDGNQKPQVRGSMKSEFVTRNFFNKTVTYADSTNKNKEYDENIIDSDNVNLTLHPKVATTGATRCLKFEPLLTDIKVRPSTPPDHGYYFKFNLSDVKLIKHLLEANGFKETNNSNSFSIMWSTGPIKNDVYQSLGYYQKVNHFPRSHEITRKDSMHRNISRMQTAYGLKNFNFIPKSFILPSETPVLEADMEKNKGMWYIVKPQASSQGRGIFITNKLDEIIAKQSNQIIVSQYINDPFLINDLKFDLRVYVAVTSINPLRIYIYKEGLARFATIPYTKDKYVNRFVHLTNYSINKKNEAFVQNDDNEDEESCSKWSFATFKTYLESIGIDHKPIFQKIEDIVVKTILSIESILFTTNVTQVPQRHNCFELFGFDILLDSKLKPWLLEVNLSPSMGCESALDLKIKSELISDLFNMAGVAPLDQRTYYETSFFGKNQNVLSYGGTAPNFDKKPQSNGYTEAKPIDSLTKEEKAVIKETNEEWERRGNFKRIYPSENVMDYKNYFETDRPYNALLRNVILNNLKKSTRKPEIPKQPINPKKFC